MPFQITITRNFSASHQLRLYDGSLEQPHRHDWVAKVVAAADQLDSIGVVMDFHALEKLLDLRLAAMQDRLLNDLPAFRQINPSAENVAVQIAAGLTLPVGVRLVSVEVWETPENSAVYRP